MTEYIALLCGINVGGHTVRMQALRPSSSLKNALGYEVATPDMRPCVVRPKRS